MSAWTLGVVELQNFGPYRRAKIDFARPGLTVIEGQIDDSSGCNSNGSGKSFILDAPSWCLYDRCLREKYHGDEVIRLLWQNGKWVERSDGEGTYVKVTLTNGVDEVSVVRYRKDPVEKDKKYLYINGQDVTRGTNPQTTLAIEHLLGMDFKLYTNGPMFGCREDVKSFFASTDADRKEILEKLLGLELYSEAQRVANSEIRALAQTLNDAEIGRVELQTRLSEQGNSLTALQTSDVVEDLEFKVNHQTVVVRNLQRAVDKAKAAAAAAAKDLEDEEAKAAAEQRVYDTAKYAWEAKNSTLRKDREKVVIEVARADGAVETCENAIADWDGRAGKECPSCRQTVGKKHVDAAVDALRMELADLNDNAAGARGRLKECDAALDAHALTIPVAPVHRLYEAENTIKDARDRELADAEAKVSEAQAVLDQLQNHAKGYEAQAHAVTQAMELTRKELEGIEATWLKNKRRCDLLQFWAEGFSNSGVKSLLIEAELPEINRRATQHAQRLLAAGTRIALSATRELKSKATREELGIEVMIPRCTKCWHGASKGQKHRLSLSLVLAFRDLLGSRSQNAFSNVFADELFDGLDKVGCKVIVQLLKEISAEVPVCIISHDPIIKTAADTVIIAHHANGEASLLAHGAVSAITTEASNRKASRGGRTQKR